MLSDMKIPKEYLEQVNARSDDYVIIAALFPAMVPAGEVAQALSENHLRIEIRRKKSVSFYEKYMGDYERLKDTSQAGKITVQQQNSRLVYLRHTSRNLQFIESTYFYRAKDGQIVGVQDPGEWADSITGYRAINDKYEVKYQFNKKLLPKQSDVDDAVVGLVLSFLVNK